MHEHRSIYQRHWTASPLPLYRKRVSPLAQFQLTCRNCDKEFGLVEEAVNLELPCPKCKRVTIFNIYNGKLSAVLARNPEAMRGEDRHDAFDRMMRSNRYVDRHRC